MFYEQRNTFNIFVRHIRPQGASNMPFMFAVGFRFITVSFIISHIPHCPIVIHLRHMINKYNQ